MPDSMSSKKLKVDQRVVIDGLCPTGQQAPQVNFALGALFMGSGGMMVLALTTRGGAPASTTFVLSRLDDGLFAATESLCQLVGGRNLRSCGFFYSAPVVDLLWCIRIATIWRFGKLCSMTFYENILVRNEIPTVR